MKRIDYMTTEEVIKAFEKAIDYDNVAIASVSMFGDVNDDTFIVIHSEEEYTQALLTLVDLMMDDYGVPKTDISDYALRLDKAVDTYEKMNRGK